jgi:hypothetical protein
MLSHGIAESVSEAHSSETLLVSSTETESVTMEIGSELSQNSSRTAKTNPMENYIFQ